MRIPDIDYKDILLLKMLVGSSAPFEIDDDNLPDEISTELSTYGLDVNKHPDSIWVRLFHLKNRKLVKEVGARYYEITELGKTFLENHLRDVEVKAETKNQDAILDREAKQVAINAAKESLQLAKEANAHADRANQISAEANLHSEFAQKRAIRANSIAIISAIIAAAALIVSLFKK